MQDKRAICMDRPYPRGIARSITNRTSHAHSAQKQRLTRAGDTGCRVRSHFLTKAKKSAQGDHPCFSIASSRDSAVFVLFAAFWAIASWTGHRIFAWVPKIGLSSVFVPSQRSIQQLPLRSRGVSSSVFGPLGHAHGICHHLRDVVENLVARLPCPLLCG